MGMGSMPQSTTMQAVRYHGQRDVRLETIDRPDLRPGSVRIAPKFCGICGTDVHEFLGGNNLIPKPGKPHPITGETSPLTLGHEFSGIVEEVADDVTTIKKGDRVCVQPIIYDGDCRSCKRGLVNCCDQNGFVGLSGWGGGLCESTVVPSSSLCPSAGTLSKCPLTRTATRPLSLAVDPLVWRSSRPLSAAVARTSLSARCLPRGEHLPPSLAHTTSSTRSRRTSSRRSSS